MGSAELATLRDLRSSDIFMWRRIVVPKRP